MPCAARISQSAAPTRIPLGALELAALAVIHVVDLPATLGPLPLVGLGYLGIIRAVGRVQTGRDYDDGIIDPVAVSMAVRGTRKIRLTPRERAEAMRQTLLRDDRAR
jgi:hypothetical protein